MIILVALVVLPGFATLPNSNASSENVGTWSVSTFGTLVASALSNSTFVGSCTLQGNTSGTSGSCLININFILSYSSFNCRLNVNITGWTIGGPSTTPEFVITSGKASAIAPSTQDSQFCVVESFPAGTVDSTTGNFIAPVYTLIPAVPGQYYLNGYGQLPANSFTSVEFTVSQTASQSLTSITVSNATLVAILANPPVSMDRTVFLSTVPSSASVGQNYTVKVLVRNNSSQPIPVFVRVVPPINVMTVHPEFVATLVPPFGQVTDNFSVVPFNSSYKGTINVTATLYIWYYNQMNRPDQVEQISSTVYTIGHYRYSSVVLTFLALLTIIPVVAATLFYRKSKARNVKESEIVPVPAIK